jgi:hypothetical protein
MRELAPQFALGVASGAKAFIVSLRPAAERSPTAPARAAHLKRASSIFLFSIFPCNRDSKPRFLHAFTGAVSRCLRRGAHQVDPSSVDGYLKRLPEYKRTQSFQFLLNKNDPTADLPLYKCTDWGDKSPRRSAQQNKPVNDHK